MYDNLRAEMARKGIGVYQLAEKAGITKQSLYRKLAGKSPFTIKEAKAIKDALEVTMSLDDLFAVNER